MLVAALLVGLVGLAGAALGPSPAPAYVDIQSTGGPVVSIIFPLEQRVSFTDTFGAPRSGGRTHEGNDLMAPKMTPILAVVPGTVKWLNLDEKPSSYNPYPAYNILLDGDDGNDYFYIHLNNDTPGTDDGQGGVGNAYAPGLTNGSRVTRGQLLGWVGDSGNAETTAPHLHFELHLGGYKNPVTPYNSLKAAPTYAEWLAASGGSTTTTIKPPAATTTTLPPTTTTTRAVTTTTTTPGGTTTTKPSVTTTEPPATTTTTVVSPLPFRDMSTDDWYYVDVLSLYQLGVIKGTADGYFRAYDHVTRAQFAALLVRAFAPSSPAVQQTKITKISFSDVSAAHWAYPEVTAAAQLGLVNGVGDGSSFAPEKLITRAQMATMISRSLDLVLGWSPPPPGPEEQQRRFSDVPGDYWAAGAISRTADLGLLNGTGDGRYLPEDSSRRAHAAAVVARTLRLRETTPAS